jgi:serine kinase of HPr protein (carbohydrate metabolism regulator)
MVLVHGTSVELSGLAVLLRGPSGAGKSDLGLRLIDGGGRLVADDQTRLEVVDGALVASAPETIAGLMEVRGLGVLPVPSTGPTRLALVVDLVAPDRVERLPDPQSATFLGHSVPLLRLSPFESSTPAKLRLAMLSLSAGQDIMGPS